MHSCINASNAHDILTLNPDSCINILLVYDDCLNAMCGYHYYYMNEMVIILTVITYLLFYYYKLFM